MKVYVVSMGNDYGEDWHVEDIFDTKKKAVACLVKLKWKSDDPKNYWEWYGGSSEYGWHYHYAMISEWEVK